MKNDKTALWAETLRTTDKEQGNSMLRYDNAFCCMGIACEIAGIHATPGQVDPNTPTVYYYLGFEHYPPAEVHEWLGLPKVHDTTDSDLTNLYLDADGFWMREKCNGDGGVSMAKGLDHYNDSVRLTFAQIGDLIAYFGVRQFIDPLTLIPKMPVPE